VQRAFDEWDMALRIDPRHIGAMKGLGFACFQLGRFEDAERYLAMAAEHGAGDAQGALATVRRSTGVMVPVDGGNGSVARTPVRPGLLFADLLSDAGEAAMLLDEDGLVLAGAYPTAEGADLAQEIGAELSGISDEARRATRHLDIGAWRAIVFETDDAVIAMTPAAAPEASDVESQGRQELVLLAASRATPLGLVRRLLDRCAERARIWRDAEAHR
jgi:predicted regulator of Ras-like GTPase activity (Roadblock/LC7/MglB family)